MPPRRAWYPHHRVDFSHMVHHLGDGWSDLQGHLHGGSRFLEETFVTVRKTQTMIGLSLVERLTQSDVDGPLVGREPAGEQATQLIDDLNPSSKSCWLPARSHNRTVRSPPAVTSPFPPRA